MEIRDVIVFIHGMMLEEQPPLGRTQYEKLWSGILEIHADLAERVDDGDLVFVEWGKFMGPQREPDQWVNFAEEFIARAVDPAELRKHPGRNNMVLPILGETPLSALAWKALAAPLRQVLLVRGMGDIVYYCGEDGRMAVQLAVFRQIFRILERHRQTPDTKVRLHLISHSMGGAIANDLLHGLFSHTGGRLREQPELKRPPSLVNSELLQDRTSHVAERFMFWREAAGERLEVGSVVTMGCPLPLMLLRSQRMVEAFGTGNVLSADEIGLPSDSSEILWKNFYDADDVFAFPVRPLFGEHPAIQDVETRAGPDCWSHAAYWGSRDVQEKVGRLLHRRCVKPRS
ncbi:MAG: hypothetical protein HY319_28985 [Armatimonadetes bacterium]|nr:hypothetical protein [Armatimonadota bacterium]